MELVDYLRLLRRRWLFLVLGLVVGLAAGYQLTRGKVPTYSSQLRLYVASSTGADASDLLNTLGQVANSGPVVAQVVQQTPGTGGIGVSAGPSGGSTTVLALTVSGTDPERVVNAAALYTTVLPKAYQQLNQYAPITLTKIDQTGAIAAPLHKSRTIAIGGFLGLLVGLGGGLLRETLDTTVRTPEELARRLDLEVLASVPEDKARGVVTILDPQSARAEAYRRVRAALRLRAADRAIRTLLVTSAASGEGKTTTALNIAAAAAQAGERVVLVDGDLRRPALAVATATRTGPGLTDVLLGSTRLPDALQAWGPLQVLVAGTPTDNPVELLGSRAMRTALDALAAEHDLVIVDSPAMLPIADAEVLAADCDAVLLVSKIGATNAPRTQKAVAALERTGREIVGVVANFASDAESTDLPAPRTRREQPQPTPLPAGEPVSAVAPLARTAEPDHEVAAPLPAPEPAAPADAVQEAPSPAPVDDQGRGPEQPGQGGAALDQLRFDGARGRDPLTDPLRDLG